jgi:RNA polymerase sigma-70 factor (ECF subfamily)
LISDEELYALVLKSDEGALEALVDRYAAPLLGFLFRLTDSAEQAQDLLQETFLRLVRYSGAPPERFRPWVYTIARNLAYDSLRARGHQDISLDPIEDMVEAGPGDETGVEPDALRAEQAASVARALQALPPAQREVVVLRFYQDLSLEEIAGVTNAPLGTVKSRLFHGLRALKGLLLRDEVHHEC